MVRYCTVQHTCLLDLNWAMPSAMAEAWPIEPTVRKSFSCPWPLATRYSNNSRDSMPVVPTITSRSWRLSTMIFNAPSLFKGKLWGRSNNNKVSWEQLNIRMVQMQKLLEYCQLTDQGPLWSWRARSFDAWQGDSMVLLWFPCASWQHTRPARTTKNNSQIQIQLKFLIDSANSLITIVWLNASVQLTLSLLSSKHTFSQPSKEKMHTWGTCSENLYYNHLSSE